MKNLKTGNIGMVGDKTGMDGWMLQNPTNQQEQVLYCHSRPWSLPIITVNQFQFQYTTVKEKQKEKEKSTERNGTVNKGKFSMVSTVCSGL